MSPPSKTQFLSKAKRLPHHDHEEPLHPGLSDCPAADQLPHLCSKATRGEPVEAKHHLHFGR
ncbi:MAG: hypothetical protein COA78_35485 [Blastopirellula sp.]|nr:MAG: hypothetical protein COA78_35485 [Blastopirellula sp.]